jgi:hypothetical protein
LAGGKDNRGSAAKEGGKGKKGTSRTTPAGFIQARVDLVFSHAVLVFPVSATACAACATALTYG